MTIGLGFLHRGGVLLCADMQMENYATKYNEPKIGYIESDCPAKIGFVIAGNVAYANSAIQELTKAVSRVTEIQELWDTIDAVHEERYTRLVLGHPDRGSVDYSLLLGVWLMGRCWLLATHQASVRSVPIYASIGIGEIIAEYVLRPHLPDRRLNESGAKIIASHTIARVKESSTSCGGVTQMLGICIKDGSAKWEQAKSVEKLSSGSVHAEDTMRPLIRAYVDAEISDDSFLLKVKNVGRRLLEDRAKYLCACPLI